jgi:AcrR family transcriptional regulator
MKASGCFHVAMMKRQTPATQDRGRRSRERILAQAIDLFAVHGFDAVTMRLLGDAAGLDNSSLYRHFPSKAALVDAVLDRVAADVFALAAPILQRETPLSVEALEEIGGAVGSYLFDHASTARLIVHWIMSMGEEGPGFRVAVPATNKARPPGKLVALFRERLDDGVKHGLLRKHATPDALVALLGAIVVRPATYGYLFKSLERTKRRNVARTAWNRELRAFIRGAFAP